MKVPTCGKCNKPVQQVKVGTSSAGIHFIAFCHQKTEEVLVPFWYLKQTQGTATIEYGTAFS